MFKKIVVSWAKDVLMGVGTGLLAAGFVGAVAPGTHPLVIATCLVVGVVSLVAALMVSLVMEATSGE